MSPRSSRPVPATLTDATAAASYAHTLSVIRRLRGAGGDAFLVGGGIRDLLLRRPVQDWDLATSVPPDELMRLFPAAIPTGLRHGTVTLLSEGKTVEITTFRVEGPYSDGRRPDWVKMPASLEDDLSRRDFTINAMAFDPDSGQFFDFHGGMEDLEARVLRAVGDADQRFQEDGLRPLRGVRLAAVLELTIEAETLAALGRSGERVAGVAAERVRDELLKLLEAPKPSRGIELLRTTGLLAVVLPELLEGVGMEQNRYHAYDVYEHSLRTLDYAPPGNRIVRLAALLHDVAKPRTRRIVEGEGTFHDHENMGAAMTRDILDRLRFSRAERDEVAHLVKEHMFHYTSEWSDAAVRRFLGRVGPDRVRDLFELREADTRAHGVGERESDELRELTRRIDAVREREEALKVEDLAVDGYDVMDRLGLPPGPRVGRVLSILLDLVLEDPSINRKEKLLSLLDQLPPS